jgi:WD40 repeat protein
MESDDSNNAAHIPQQNVPIPSPLCLSVKWDYAATSPHHHQHQQEQQIVSTYSDGRVALYDVFLPIESHITDICDTTVQKDSVELVLRDSWKAHSIFTSPTEVWSASFVADFHTSMTSTTTTTSTYDNDSKCSNHKSRTILTCGDEGYIKFWDVRSTNRPILIIKDQYDAGVTCTSQHPRHSHLVACGSYDETIALYDVRYLSSSKSSSLPLARSDKLGGGIWRIKWHPINDDRILVAAMHGGCRLLMIVGWDEYMSSNNNVYQNNRAAPFASPTQVLYTDQHLWNVPNVSPSTSSNSSSIQQQTLSSTQTIDSDQLSTPSMSIEVYGKFTEHESMVYGADWVVCPHPTQNGYFEAATSCSFYDRSVYLWDTVFA